MAERARARNVANVEALKRSVSELCLKLPITVRRCERGLGDRPEEGFEIMAGHHSYEAARELDWKEIECIVTGDDELRQELWQIEENVCRGELGEAEQAKAMTRLKEIYEALRPETTAGQAQAIGMNRKLGHDVEEKSAPTFARDTATRIGRSERHAK